MMLWGGEDVADRRAHALRRGHRGLGQAERAGGGKLEVGEEDVGGGGRARDEGAEHADRGREHRPGRPRPRRGLGQRRDHARVHHDAGEREHRRQRHRHGKEPDERGTERGRQIRRPPGEKRAEGEPREEERAGVVERLEPPGESAVPRPGDGHTAQRVAERIQKPRGKDEGEDDDVGREVRQEAAQPWHAALAPPPEIEDEEDGAGERAAKARHLGPRQRREREGGREERRRRDGAGRDVRPREPPLAREPHHEEEEPRPEERVDQGDPARELRGRQARERHLRERGGAHRAEGHARRVAEERQHHRAHRIVAEPDKKGCRQRHGRAEPGRAFDEEAEEPRDQDRLGAPVVGQPAERVADAQDRAGPVLELVERERGQDDPEDHQRRMQRLERCARGGGAEPAGRRGAEVEGRDGEEGGHGEPREPSLRRRPAERHHAGEDHRKGQRGEDGAHGAPARGISSLRRGVPRRCRGRWALRPPPACRPSAAGRRGCAGAVRRAW
jgi:hypothetical protein